MGDSSEICLLSVVNFFGENEVPTFISSVIILFFYHTADYVCSMIRRAMYGVGGETAEKVSSILILSKSLILTAA